PLHDRSSSRSARLLVAVLATMAVVALALVPRGTSAQTAPLLDGRVPVPGASGMLSGRAGTTIEVITAALNEQGCYPSHLWVQTGGRWVAQVQDVPDFVNAAFPRALTEQAPLFVRCASELDVKVTNGTVTLAGTLTLPPLPAP